MAEEIKTPKVALVYDRVNTPHGGAEQVLLALHTLYPQAPLFTAVYNPQQALWSRSFPQIIPGFLHSFPLVGKLYRWVPFLMPLIFESFDFHEYDIVISVTSAEAKGVLTLPHQLHVCYLLTPQRYLYQGKQQSLQSHWVFRIPGAKTAAKLLLSYLTWWDQQAIFRPDSVVPISRRVSERVARYYPQISPLPVLYPPVKLAHRKTNLSQNQLMNSQRLSGKRLPEHYFLIVSRLVYYKHIDRAMKACFNTKKHLVIVGNGPEKQSLMKLANRLSSRKKSSSEVFFQSNLSEKELDSLYQNCDAVLIPGEEDFGLVTLEANSYGKPVIIQQKSGAAECINHTVHGIHIMGETVKDIEKAITLFEKTSFLPTRLVHNSQKYGTNTFIQQFRSLVQNLWEEKQKALL